MNISTFARLCGLVKNVKRTGWLRYLPPEHVESVGDHSCRIAMLTMALRNTSDKIDQKKCMEMALIHDIGEGLVGDFTPHCKITYWLFNEGNNRNFRSNSPLSSRF